LKGAGKLLIQIDPSETSLVVTEPVLDLPILQASYDQIVFEEYEFHSYFRTTGIPVDKVVDSSTFPGPLAKRCPWGTSHVRMCPCRRLRV